MSMFRVRTFYKVFVTRDFPRIYEERVMFENNNPDNTTAIVREGYGHDDPYVGDVYHPPELLKPGEWFWSFKEAKKDWNLRRKKAIAAAKEVIANAEAKVQALEQQAFKKADVEPGEFCKALPDGKEAQITRYEEIEKRFERERLERDIKQHEAALKAKAERLQSL